NAQRNRVGTRARLLDTNNRRRIGSTIFNVSSAGCELAINHPHPIDGTSDLIGMTVCRECPHQPLVAKIPWNNYFENILVASDREMSRLAAITSGFEGVIGPNRDIRFLFVIVVHVAEPNIECSVRVDIKTLVHGGDALTRPMAKLHKLVGRGL